MKVSDPYQQSMCGLIWVASGRPAQAGVVEAPGRCWHCGGSMQRGLAVGAWAGEGFNAYARAQHRHDPSATYVCEACVFICSRLSPVPGRPPKAGKKLGGNFRNYSHAVAVRDDGSVRYLNASKAELGQLVDFIRDPGGDPWALAIGTSGQKHVIPYATMNRRGPVAVVAFEEESVRFKIDDFLALNERMNRLRASSGCGAEAIRTGEYHPKDLDRGLEVIEMFEAKHRHMRGGGLFNVAAFLTSKESDA